MLYVCARNLDREANLAVTELFDLRLHRAAIRANPVGSGALLPIVASHRLYPESGAAGVAELANAPGLGPGELRLLEVRVLSPALLGLGVSPKHGQTERAAECERSDESGLPRTARAVSARYRRRWGRRSLRRLVDVDRARPSRRVRVGRSEEHTSELQSRGHLVCRLLLEKK